MEYNLDRFFKAQKVFYKDALEEIQQGQKQSHWMWFIFPQIIGLGRTGESGSRAAWKIIKR